MAINKTVRNAIADDAITSDKIEDGAITSGKLGAGNISLSKTPLGNAAPTISSLDTSQINPDSGATVTITGTGFVSIPDVRFLNTSTGARIQASTVAFTSSTIIAAAFPSGQTGGTYKVLVENTDGKGAISTSTITYSLAPTWSTAANLGSIEEGEAVNIQLLAYDDDSTAVSSYSLVSGSLPSGVTLSGDSSVGSLTGTAPAVDADTNYTFTIRATDDESQTSDREFTLTVTNWTVANSLRFNDGSSDNLSGTLSSGSGSDVKGTISLWVKRSHLGTNQAIICGKKANTERVTIGFTTDDYFEIQFQDNTNAYYWRSSAVYRDVSAWYNFIIKLDTGNGTANSRARVWVNNSEITSWSTQETCPQNLKIGFFNDTNTRLVGARGGSSTDKFYDGYICEVVGINNALSDNTDFGETDTSSGIWKPKSVSGLTFGTNGFYLPFTNSASLGADSSGNSNDFTVNNLTAIDQTTDTPVNNFATFNSLISSRGQTFSEGNLQVATTVSDRTGGSSTIGMSSGKWFAEFKISAYNNNRTIIGITSNPSELDRTNVDPGSLNYGSGIYFDGRIYVNTSVVTTVGETTLNDIIGVAVNLDDNNILYYINGVVQNSGTPISITASSSTDTGNYFFSVGDRSGTSYGTVQANFGSPPFSISSGNSDANGYGNFEYAVPSGYFALNTKNLAEYG